MLERPVRLLLVVALLAMPACLTQCDGVGAIGSMRQGAMTHGAARGDMTSPSDGAAAPAVVGVDWPEGGAYGTLQILYEAEKETTFADNDPVETPTHFGALTLALTQAVEANRLTYQSPCDVGPAIACYYDDGSDYWADTIVRSALNFLHDGTGGTCYFVVEPSSSAGSNGVILATKTSTSTSLGLRVSFTNSTTDRIQATIGNGSAAIILAVPGSGSTGIEDQTWAAAFAHGTAQDPDFAAYWRGVVLGGSTTPTDYSAAASTSDHSAAMSIGAFANGTSAFLGWIFTGGCYDAIHGATELSGVWAAIEAVTGALPQ